ANSASRAVAPELFSAAHLQCRSTDAGASIGVSPCIRTIALHPDAHAGTERKKPAPRTGRASRKASARLESARLESAQRAATCFASEDLRLAAWFSCTTPLLTALSSFFDASLSVASAAVLSPLAMASRALRTTVLSSDLTVLLRA